MRPIYKKLRSGLEDSIKADLDKKGIKYGYESIKLKYIKTTCRSCGEPVTSGIYTPDFIIERNTGIRLVIEAKGRFTSSDRTKMLNVLKHNPQEDIRFIFQRDQRIRKGSKTTYSEWAIKNGFKYYIGKEVPNTWLSEALNVTSAKVK